MKSPKNKVGKTLTIFLAVISILLLSLTVITLFFFQKENENRTLAESKLEDAQLSQNKLQDEVKEAKKQSFLLEEKLKEADGKINNLMDDLELEKGLREEIKTENVSLKDALAKENQAKEKLLQQVETIQAHNKELTEKIAQLQKYLEQALVPPPDKTTSAAAPAPKTDNSSKGNPNVSSNAREGKIINVDLASNFVIMDLGQKDGVSDGQVFSVFHDSTYLGDVKVSRVQPEMSAADLIPPLSSDKIAQNDRVVTKQ